MRNVFGLLMKSTSTTSSPSAPRAPLPFLGLACAVGVSTIYYNQPLLLEMGRTYRGDGWATWVCGGGDAGGVCAGDAAVCAAGRCGGAARR